MPLPINSTLPLVGKTPAEDTFAGDTTLLKLTKKAMIIRMSAETMEALEAYPRHPPVDFQFGDNPGIYIGNAFFPVRPLKEVIPHELYTRAPSAARKMPPLRLCANVIGKFTVQRQLDDGVRDKVRESTLDAANQRSARTTIILDTPPDILSRRSSKKRKESHPNSTLLTNRRNSTPTSGSVSSLIPSQSSLQEGPIPLRKRMIHCLAISERTSEQVVRLVGGPECSAQMRQEILGLLDELADLIIISKDGKSPKSFRLKTALWLDVRPYDWPKLTENERTTMARNARQAFKQLGIPESDSAWTHVRYRTTSQNTNMSRTPSSISPLNPSGTALEPIKSEPMAKRGLSSKGVKEKKIKGKTDGNAKIMMKDESVRSTPISQKNGNAKEGASYQHKPSTASTSTTHAPVTAPARKPGSGFKVTKSERGRLPDHGESDGSTAFRKASEPRRLKETQRPSLSASQVLEQKDRVPSPLPKIHRIDEKVSNTIPDQERKRDHDLLRDREREHHRDLDRVKDRVRTKEREEGEHSESIFDIPLKRKKQAHDLDEDRRHSRGGITAKRRKVDSSTDSISTMNSVPTSRTELTRTSTKGRNQDPSPSLPLPLPKIRKDPNAAQSSFISNHSSSSSSSHTLVNPSGTSNPPQNSGVARSRRRSPIYTSSEEDSDSERRQTSKVDASQPFIDNQAASHKSSQPSESSAHQAQTLPADHESLRIMYNACYHDYLGTYRILYEQKNKMAAILNKSDVNLDSDADVDILEVDDLMRLTKEHRDHAEKLESIRRLF